MTRHNGLSSELIRPLTDMNHIGSLLLHRKENYTGRGVIATTTVRSATSSMNLKGRRPRISAASSQRLFWSAHFFFDTVIAEMQGRRP